MISDWLCSVPLVPPCLLCARKGKIITALIMLFYHWYNLFLATKCALSDTLQHIVNLLPLSKTSYFISIRSHFLVLLFPFIFGVVSLVYWLPLVIIEHQYNLLLHNRISWVYRLFCHGMTASTKMQKPIYSNPTPLPESISWGPEIMLV